MRHAASAHGAGRLDHPDGTAMLDNPLCGDRVTMDVKMAGGRIAEVAQESRACVLCQASASIIAAAALGQTPQNVAEAGAALAAMLKENSPAPDGKWADLAVFETVRGHKSRYVCVLLPFETLGQALEKATLGTVQEV